MGTLGLVFFIVLSCGLLAWGWVRGIDYMKENHPDYKGEDFLNWDNDDADVTKIAGRDGWDDNLVHTEGDF
jgi:hypothetical protein